MKKMTMFQLLVCFQRLLFVQRMALAVKDLDQILDELKEITAKLKLDTGDAIDKTILSKMTQISQHLEPFSYKISQRLLPKPPQFNTKLTSSYHGVNLTFEEYRQNQQYFDSIYQEIYPQYAGQFNSSADRSRCESPAAVCAMITRSILLEHLNFSRPDSIINILTTIRNFNWFNSFRQAIVHKDDYILDCQWLGKDCQITEFFSLFGTCFHIVAKNAVDQITHSTGTFNKVSITMNMEVFDVGRTGALLHFRPAAKAHNLALTTNGIQLKPGYQSEVAITQVTNVTQNKRRCGSRELKYFNDYTKENCEWEEETKEYENLCNCSLLNSPSIIDIDNTNVQQICNIFQLINCSIPQGNAYNCPNDCNKVHYHSDLTITVLDITELREENRVDLSKLRLQASKRIEQCQNSALTMHSPWNWKLMQLLDQFFKFHLTIIKTYSKIMEMPTFYQKWYFQQQEWSYDYNSLLHESNLEPILHIDDFFLDKLVRDDYNSFRKCFNFANNFIELNYTKSLGLSKIGNQLLSLYDDMKNISLKTNGSFMVNVYNPFLNKLNEEMARTQLIGNSLENKFLLVFVTSFEKYGQCFHTNNSDDVNNISQQYVENCILKSTTLKKHTPINALNLHSFQSMELTAIDDLRRFLRSSWLEAGLKIKEKNSSSIINLHHFHKNNNPFATFNPEDIFRFHGKSLQSEYVIWLQRDFEMPYPSTLSRAMTLTADAINVANVAQTYKQNSAAAKELENRLKTINEAFFRYYNKNFQRYFQAFADKIGLNSDLYAILALDKKEDIIVIENTFQCLHELHNNMKHLSESPVLKRTNIDDPASSVWLQNFRELIDHGLKMYRPGTEYEQTNLAKVDIYFRSFRHKEVHEIEFYTIWNLLSDIGGASGLWVGATLITIYEVLLLVCFPKHVRSFDKQKIQPTKP